MKGMLSAYEGEHIHQKWLNSDLVSIVQCGFIIISPEDEFGKKKIIDFKISGENLKSTKTKFISYKREC